MASTTVLTMMTAMVATASGSVERTLGNLTVPSAIGDDTGTVKERLEARARQNVVLSVLSFIFNSVLLGVVFVSPRLRNSAKYQMICSLSFADVILVGMVYLPLDASAAMNDGHWPYHCSLYYLVSGLHEFVTPTITALTLSALCLEYATTICCEAVTPGMKRRVVAFGILAPWLFAISSLAMVMLNKVVTSSGIAAAASCEVVGMWDLGVWVVLLGLYGFLPLMLLLVCLVLMLVCRFFRPPNHRMVVRTIISRSDGVILSHEMTDTFFACLISLAFSAPVLVDLTFSFVCLDGSDSCGSPGSHDRHALEVLRTAESVILPAVWMLGMEFRQGLFTSCRCCYRHCDMEMEHAFHEGTL